MAYEVICSHLQSKFSSILLEAEADPISPLIISRFRSIEKLINLKSETIGATPKIVELLYKLIDELLRCRTDASAKGLFRTITIPSPSCFHCKSRSTINRLEDIEDNLNKEEPERLISRLVIQQTYPEIDTSGIIEFDSHTKRVKKILRCSSSDIVNNEEAEGLTLIGIVGKSGCGKTALAQKVFASPSVQENFSPRIWVCLSNIMLLEERVDPRVRVLNYILEEIGHDISELEYADFSVIKLLERLQRGLMGKRYLIVLDNAWRLDEWYSDLGYSLPRGRATGELLSHGLPKGSGGGIIVTSRSENVVRQVVGDKHVISLDSHLSDDICWKIFTNVVGQRTGGIGLLEGPMLKKMKDDIIRNCHGLPLAARTLADIIPQLLENHDLPSTAPHE